MLDILYFTFINKLGSGYAKFNEICNFFGGSFFWDFL